MVSSLLLNVKKSFNIDKNFQIKCKILTMILKVFFNLVMVWNSKYTQITFMCVNLILKCFFYTSFKQGLNEESICKTIAYKTPWEKPLQKLTKQTRVLMESVASNL